MSYAVICPASIYSTECAAVGIITRIKAAALFGCLLFVSNAFAVDYYWTSQIRPGNFASAYEACKPSIGAPFGGTATFSRVDFGGSQLSGTCVYVWGAANDEYRNENVYRNGDKCPTGTGPYNPLKGDCPKPVDPPLTPGEKCKDQSGGTSSNPMIWDATTSKCTKFLDAKGDAPCAYIKGIGGGPTAYTVAGNLDAGGNAVAPPSFADESISCTVQTISTSECTLNVAGAISCNVTGLLTGKANAGGTNNAAEALCPSGNCPVKEPKTETKEEGCTPAGNGSGGSTCTQTKETTKEGTQQCGTVNGAYKCVTKPPFSNAVKTTITATSETLSDGSVKVTTVKDSANTVCTDVKTCTTQTSTTVSHNTTKPSGGTTSGSTCTGACTPNGGGVETNPTAGTGNTGNGNGSSGNGDGDGEGEGGDGTASTTSDCAIPPPCDGDPFQCAILQQAHIDTCKLMAPPTAEQQALADAKVTEANAQLDAHQSELDQKANTLLSQFQSSTPGTGTGGGKCLPDFNFSVMGMSQSMEFSKVCDSISWVRLMVLAGAYLFAARIVSREV